MTEQEERLEELNSLYWSDEYDGAPVSDYGRGFADAIGYILTGKAYLTFDTPKEMLRKVFPLRKYKVELFRTDKVVVVVDAVSESNAKNKAMGMLITNEEIPADWEWDHDYAGTVAEVKDGAGE